MKYIIVDDEKSAINILEKYGSEVSQLEHLGSFQKPVEALQFTRSNLVELIFLDINMPDLSGMAFLELLEKKCKVIITTAYSEYAIEGYQYEILDYLLKPISFDKFLKAVLRALPKTEDHSNTSAIKSTTEYNIADENFIMVQTGYKGSLTRIKLDEIDYIEAALNYLTIYMSGQRKIMVHMSMKDIVTKLPEKQFKRIHKSYIVALSQVKKVEKGYVELYNISEKFPVGITYKSEFFKAIE